MNNYMEITCFSFYMNVRIILEFVMLRNTSYL